MSDASRKAVTSAKKKSAWKRPKVTFVGNVNQVFQFPGGGKLSMVAEDMGDAQRKPKGQE
jgi:hypothetical protein